MLKRLAAVLLLLALACPAWAGTTYRFKGYDAWITYTLPVPPGTPALKERVQVGDNIPREAVLSTLIAMQALLNSLQQTMAPVSGSPFDGWAPFAGGTEIQPDYEVIVTP